MYTIRMGSDKSLITTQKTTLYQREKDVDKIQFLLPQIYEPKNIAIHKCTIILKYTDQGNVAHAIKLIPDDELYKNHVRCELDVDLRFTKFAGDITIYLDFLMLNSDNGIYESVLTSGETTITIQPRSDWFAFCADESLDVINKAMLELEAKANGLGAIADLYSAEKADNIVKIIDGTDIKIQLSSNGNPIGDEVSVGDTGEEGVSVVEIDASNGSVPDDTQEDDVIIF